MHRSRGHAATRRTNRGVAAVAAAAATDDDPFGCDGFGDTWNKPPKASFYSDSDDDEFQLQTTFCGAEFDWAVSAKTLARKKAEEDARRTKEKEESDKRVASIARMKKKKAASEAAKKALGIAEAKAKKQWDFQVEKAKKCLALAKPAQALQILYFLFGDESFIDTIDMEEQANVAHFIEALENHSKLQQTLAIKIDEDNGAEESISIQCKESSDVESTSTIGGDTVVANHYSSIEEGEDDSKGESGTTTVVVDRMPF